MKRLILITVLGFPLAGCGWWDGAFAPYYPNPYSSYGDRYGQIQPQRGPGFNDRRSAKGQLAIEGGVGADFITSGKLIQGNQTVTQSLSMKDAYGTGRRYAVRATYPRPTANRYFTASAYRSEFDGKAQSFSAPQTVSQSGTLSDYTSQGVEFGLRQYSARPFGVAHPYAEARLGGAYVDDISVVQGAQRTALYQGGWVPTGAAVVGFEVPAMNRFTVGLETGLRYQGRLSVANTPEARVITNNRGTGSLVTVPLTLRGRYRF